MLFAISYDVEEKASIGSNSNLAAIRIYLFIYFLYLAR